MVDVGRNWLSQLCNCDNVVSSRVISRVLLTIPFAPTSSERMNTNVGNKIYWRSADYPSRSIGRRWIILLLRIWIWYTTFTILIVLVVCVFVTTFACVHTNNACTATETTGGRTYYIRVLIVANSIVHLFLVIYVLYNTLFLIIYLVYICLLIKHQPHYIGDGGGEQHGDDAVVQPASPSW